MELGTVIRAYYTANSSSSSVVTWFKNGDTLLNDPPHIRIRSSTDDTVVTSVHSPLTILLLLIMEATTVRPMTV